jgi:hypothetical protein
MTLGSTQPLTEMSTRNLPGGKGWPVRKSDNLIAICLDNVGASTSHNPMGLHGLLQGELYLYLILYMKVTGNLTENYISTGLTPFENIAGSLTVSYY